MSAYCASKHDVIGLMCAVAADTIEHDVLLSSRSASSRPLSAHTPEARVLRRPHQHRDAALAESHPHGLAVASGGRPCVQLASKSSGQGGQVGGFAP
jgi:hypothetical protein